nr:MAG TPA: DNA topoisomerase small subunit, 30S, translation, bypassing [Caudoviricetes sp.]
MIKLHLNNRFNLIIDNLIYNKVILMRDDHYDHLSFI